MDENIKSTTAEKTGGTAKGEQAFTASKYAVPRRRANVKMVQNILLVSPNKNIDDNSSACRNTVDQLQRLVNDLITFTDDDECIEFIETIDDTKACIIIPGYLGQHIVPRVHKMPQVDSIFIFCSNTERYEEWARYYSKIKGIFTDVTPICEALNQAAHRCEQNAISISIMAITGDISKNNPDQLDSSFMYTQILKEILLTIKFEARHIDEFIEYCRDLFPRTNNKHELRTVTELERNYRDKKNPIWWYTSQSFLYPMLNCALRLMDVEHLIKMGFFIDDLHQHIEQLHKEQFGGHNSSKIFKVYRGQGLGKEEFEKITKAKDGLISFNNFLSTSYDRDVAYLLADSNQVNSDLVGILFEMTIDPSKSSAPFASIKDYSYFEEEDEVLFSMHTVFRIGNITPIADKVFQANLTLTDVNDKDLRVLTDRIREEINPDEAGWYRLGSLLLKMGESDQAQQVFETLLAQKTNDDEKGRIYHRLGLVKYDQGKYKEALIFYGKAIAIRQQSFPPNPDLANSHNNIGLVYNSMHEYSKALSSYEKALEIQQQLLPPNHPHVASSYCNIGNVYFKMGEYAEALSSHEKALAIKQQSLPSNHPDLASSYSNIGNVYYNMCEYSKALSSHEKALEIQQQSLPPNHPHLASSYNNIGNVYYTTGEYSKALSFHEKALAIKQQSLPSNHPELGSAYNNIGFVYEDMGDSSKARSFYEQAVDNGEQSLPANHPILEERRRNLQRVRRRI